MLRELGKGFAFVGRQHHLQAGDHDFYLDLSLYHLRLRCFVGIYLLSAGSHNTPSPLLCSCKCGLQR